MSEQSAVKKYSVMEEGLISPQGLERYPQDEEQNEYRYIHFPWLDKIAEGLTAGARKHPGETWRSIPAEEHAARALRHLSLWLAGDRSDSHIINASMRCMMAFAMMEEAEVGAR